MISIENGRHTTVRPPKIDAQRKIDFDTAGRNMKVEFGRADSVHDDVEDAELTRR